MVMTVMGLLYLCVNTYTDIRSQEILWPLGTSVMAAGLILHMILRDMTAVEWLLGISIGAGLSFISIMTKESIGLGDCLVIAVMGSLIGMQRAFNIFIAALLLSAVYAVVLYMIHTQKTKARFPFMPFLSAAYVLLLLKGGF